MPQSLLSGLIPPSAPLSMAMERGYHDERAAINITRIAGLVSHAVPGLTPCPPLQLLGEGDRG
jgi:hypothetical protein